MHSQASCTIIDVSLARNMAGVYPLGAVGGSWQTKGEMDEKDETALPKNKTKADNIGEVMLSTDDVGKSRDSCELEGKISKESDGPVYGTENEAEVY